MKGKELQSRNTQGAYLLDKQRLAASVTTRSWSVMRAQSFAGERSAIGLAQLALLLGQNQEAASLRHLCRDRELKYLEESILLET